jgi:hypothetical protein
MSGAVATGCCAQPAATKMDAKMIVRDSSFIFIVPPGREIVSRLALRDKSLTLSVGEPRLQLGLFV